MHGLIAWMSELIGLEDTLPGLYRLGFLPAQFSNWRCGVWDSPVYKYTRKVGLYALYLSPFN